MKPHIPLLHASQNLLLLPEGAAYWPEQHMLFCADLHLGKAAAFQDAGLAIPEGADAQTLSILENLLHQHAAQRVVLLGDVFHARSPSIPLVLLRLAEFRERHPSLEWWIVPGNHDRKVPWAEWLPWASIYPEGTELSPWRLHHHPPEQEPEDELLNLCGHLHPGVALGPPRMRKLRSKCFWLRDGTLVFPAFGMFTGSEAVQRQTGDRVWIVTEQGIAELPRV